MRFYDGGLAAPKDVLKAVKRSIDAGLPADAALRSLTLYPAEIFGVSDRLGSIEVGKIANLVVTDGDLFKEKTKIKMVFVDGHKFDPREPEKPKDPPKGDITGKWKLAFTTPEGAEEATADLTMASDGALSGTVTGKRGVGTILNGYATADKFTFTINIPVEGNPTDVIFTGTFDATSLKGSTQRPGILTSNLPARSLLPIPPPRRRPRLPLPEVRCEARPVICRHFESLPFCCDVKFLRPQKYSPPNLLTQRPQSCSSRTPRF